MILSSDRDFEEEVEAFLKKNFGAGCVRRIEILATGVAVAEYDANQTAYCDCFFHHESWNWIVPNIATILSDFPEAGHVSGNAFRPRITDADEMAKEARKLLLSPAGLRIP